LRYRRGYYGVQNAPAPQSKAELKQVSYDFAQALDPDLPAATGLPFQAKVVPPAAAGGKVTVLFAVDAHALQVEQLENGLMHAKVSCIAWAFPVKGKPIGSGGSTMNANIDLPTYEKMLRSAFPCTQKLDLPAGNYMLRVGVIDLITQHIGALTAWVTVPDFAAPSLPVAPDPTDDKKPESPVPKQ